MNAVLIDTHFLIGIALTWILGSIIGLERELKGKPTGVKTQTLVMGASMLFSYLSITLDGADPSRIAAQIVTGIGFLGAGIIFRGKGGHVANVTSAASVWYSAAVGMAIGLGYYFVAIIATLFVVIVGHLPNLDRFFKE